MMARKYIDVRKFAETKPAFEHLSKYMLALHGKKVEMHWYPGQKDNPWLVFDKGYTSPLICQASRSHMDKHLYPSSKKVMANKLINEFLPKVGYTLEEMVETKPWRTQGFWIRVKELKTIAFHVFQFRGGGIGVAVGTIHGDFGMLVDIEATKAQAKVSSKDRKAFNV